MNETYGDISREELAQLREGAATCLHCGMLATVDPVAHEGRYGHRPEIADGTGKLVWSGDQLSWVSPEPDVEPTRPVDRELFRRTAPQWNCVDYPGDGMHYTPGTDCAWCGMTREQIAAEWEALERDLRAAAGDDQAQDAQHEADQGDEPVDWAGRTFGQLSPDEKRRAAKAAGRQLSDELTAAAPAISKILAEGCCPDCTGPGQLKADPSELNDRMDFDHVVRVDDDGILHDNEGSHAPELIMFVDEDGQALPDSDAELHRQAESAGWRLEHGWTGQYGYAGPVMHPSEYVGGALAEHIIATPGEWVVTAVETDGDDGEPAGWAIAFREVPSK